MLAAKVDDAAVGQVTSETYMAAIDTPENLAFIERWKKVHGNSEYPVPDYSIGKAYNMVHFLAAAIEKANSSDAGKIIAAWEGLTFKGVIGTQTMRACDHQILAPVAYTKIAPGPTKYYSFASPADVKQLPAEEAAVAHADTGNPRCK